MHKTKRWKRRNRHTRPDLVYAYAVAELCTWRYKQWYYPISQSRYSWIKQRGFFSKGFAPMTIEHMKLYKECYLSLQQSKYIV